MVSPDNVFLAFVSVQNDMQSSEYQHLGPTFVGMVQNRSLTDAVYQKIVAELLTDPDQMDQAFPQMFTL